MNHLAVFADNYLELIGVSPGGSERRRELLTYPAGLNGLVFVSEDPAETYGSLESLTVPFDPPVDFSRPLIVDGQREEVAFSGIFMKPGTIEYGRVYFCFHKTPELVWRTEWQYHENGATNIDRMIIVAANPRETSELYASMFGENAIRDREGGKSLIARNGMIDIITEKTFQDTMGTAAAESRGRTDYMAGLTLRTSSLDQTNRYFNDDKVAVVCRHADRIVVPAHLALNTTLEFVER